MHVNSSHYRPETMTIWHTLSLVVQKKERKKERPEPLYTLSVPEFVGGIQALPTGDRGGANGEEAFAEVQDRMEGVAGRTAFATLIPLARVVVATVHITKQIDSERLDLPELRPFIGKQVEIVITEALPDQERQRWQALAEAGGANLVDPEVARQYRELGRWPICPLQSEVLFSGFRSVCE